MNHSWRLSGQALVAAIFMLWTGTARAQYQAITVTDGGSVTGTVKWSGARPQPVTLPITKNPEVCAANGEKIRDLERIVISPDGGVENTVVYLKDITKGKAMDLPVAERTLDQKNCRYVPHVMLVPKGGEFDMVSSDPILHNVHMTGAELYNIPFPIANHVVKRTFNRDGVANLKCDAGHVWMNAVVLTVDHPYYAITDARGNFTIKDIPAGTYTIEAWHEGWHVAREESVMDVDANQMVSRPIFTEPLTWDEKVTVAAKETAKVDFTLSEK
ncbi:MAG TPA: carboxypeptidase-like regulatory domain-containing protein [Verrucomicrobiae bacterium]|nr:carboxypeptidase-like regulatory domain-containing protein [Verrucomicrobiae bacterium]